MTVFGYAAGLEGTRNPGPDEYLRRLSTRVGTRHGSSTLCTSRSGALVATHAASDGGVTVGIRGQPSWRTQERDVIAAADPAAALLAAYRRWGTSLFDKLHGSFAIAIQDDNTATTLLAIDRMGIERMCYSTAGGVFTYGCSAQHVAHSPQARAGLSSQSLFDFLILHMVPAPNTAYAGVFKLRPATVATYHAGRVATKPYWLPAFNERSANEGELAEQLHAALASAVRDCAPDATTGSFLSGGLDSSTVSGTLGKVSGRPARTFSIGFGEESYNELAYARIAARHFGFQATEYEVTAADITTAFPLIAGAYDEPFGNSSAVPTYYCARLAREHGITHLLAGDGGDELFGGNDRYAKQRIFEIYQGVPAALRRVLEPTVLKLPEEGAPLPLHKLRSYVDQARIPLPRRLESWNLMYRVDLAPMLDPEFLASIDTQAVLRLMDELYAAAPASSMLNKLLYYDWHLTLADDDLRKVGTMCELAGIKVSFPMLNTAVVDVANRVPPGLKMRGLKLRWFFKRAMANFLPREIIEKQKHGFGLPFGQWLKTDRRLAELIFGHLLDLRARRMIRPQFLEDLIEQHRAGHPTYFGYAIWDLAMLEAWLKAHVDTAAA